MDNKSQDSNRPLDDGITTPAKARHESRLVYLVAIGMVVLLSAAAWYITSRT